MSISTNIDGSSGTTNQLFDLLTVVSNPDAYKAKITALETATAENKKYVEALGPASEIVALRNQTAALRQEAQDYRDAAITEADIGIQEARAKANGIAIEAQKKADALIAETTAAKEAAEQLAKQNRAALVATEKALFDAEKAKAVAESKAQELEQAITDAQAAAADARATKAAIVAKHQAFIGSL